MLGASAGYPLVTKELAWKPGDMFHFTGNNKIYSMSGLLSKFGVDQFVGQPSMSPVAVGSTPLLLNAHCPAFTY